MKKWNCDLNFLLLKSKLCGADTKLKIFNLGNY